MNKEGGAAVTESLSRFTEVWWPMSVARASAGVIRSGLRDEERDQDEMVRHAAIVVVFSAAAVESALNTVVSRPVLDIGDPATRQFYGRLLHHYFRGTIPDKLRFLLETWPTLKGNKRLLSQVRSLATARNGLMHIYPEHVVALGVQPDAAWPVGEGDWVEYHDLQWTQQHLADPATALSMHEAAETFIDALPLTLPEYVPVRFAGDEPRPSSDRSAD